MDEKTHFVKQVIEYLYPKKNRVIASVAAVRTFRQTLVGAFTVGGAGLITINATDLAQLNWDIVIYTAIALFLSAVISANVAFEDVSRNGLNSKYMDAANPPAPVYIDTAVVESAVKGLSTSRPFWMVPAPEAAPAPVATAPVEEKKPAAAAVKKATTRAAKKAVADRTITHVEQAPANEIAD